MEGMFDTDTNTLTWTVTYSGPSSPPIAAHFHGPISYLGLDFGGERPSRSERRAISRAPSTASPRSTTLRPRT